VAFFLPRKPKTKSKRDILVKLDEFFTSALDHPTWVDWRKHAEQTYAYKEGDQWTAAEKEALKERNQPATVNNQVNVTINRLVGQFVKQRTRIGYRGRNGEVDDPVANTLSDTYLFIKQNNALEFEERDVADDGFTSGFGCFHTDVTFDDLFNPEIRVRHVDPLDIYPDPYSRRYDWNQDAKFICWAKWVDPDEAKELYPNKSGDIAMAMTAHDYSGVLAGVDSFKNENYYDRTRNRIRIIECWYKTRQRETVLLGPKDETINATEEDMSESDIKKKMDSDDGYRRIDRVKSKMNVGIFSGGILFEHKEVQGLNGRSRENFPFVPYMLYRKKNGEPYSLIHIAISMQDAINKRESKGLHLLSTNQSVFEQGAVADLAKHATEKAKPDGIIELLPGYFEKFVLANNLEMGASQVSMGAEAKNDFRRITGINPDALGERSEVRSGVGIARKQAMTDVIIAPIFDNFRRTRQMLAKNILELVQIFMTEKKIFTITDDLNASKQIVLNSDDNQAEAIKQGIFDVVVEDMPDTTTIQEEQMQLLATTLPQILPFGPAWTEILFEMSSIRNKDAILNKVRQASGPPPTEPKISVSVQMNELSPVERAFFYGQMGSPDVAKAVMDQKQDPAYITKAKVDIQKEGIEFESEERDREVKELEIATKAATERAKDNGKRDSN